MRDRLVTLQSLRFMAATLVVADHALGPVIGWRLLPGWMTDFRWNLGALGVAIFFVISGYIMMRTSGDRYGSPASALGFAVRRILRIVPIYWIGTLLAFVHSDHSLFKLVCSLVFIPYLAAPGAAMRPLLGQGWTLDYEMLFYALFAVCLLAPKKTGLAIFFATIAATVGVGLFLPAGLQDSFPGEIAVFFSRPILLLFPAGMGLALLEDAGIVLPKVRQPLAVILILIAMTMTAIFIGRIPEAKPALGQIAFWIPALLIVAVAVGAGATRPAGEAPLLSRLGDASYSVYIFHFFLILGLEKLFSGLHPSALSAVAFVAIALAGANLLGLALYDTIERPLTDRLNALVRRRPASARPGLTVVAKMRAAAGH